MEPYLKNRTYIRGTIVTIALSLAAEIAHKHPADLHFESSPNQVAGLELSRVNVTLASSASSSASLVMPTKLIF